MAFCENNEMVYMKEPACGTLYITVDETFYTYTFSNKIQLKVSLTSLGCLGLGRDSSVQHDPAAGHLLKLENDDDMETESFRDLEPVNGGRDEMATDLVLHSPPGTSLMDILLKENKKVGSPNKEADILIGRGTTTVVDPDQSRESNCENSKRNDIKSVKTSYNKLKNDGHSVKKRRKKSPSVLSASDRDGGLDEAKCSAKLQVAYEVTCQFCLKVFQNQQDFYNHKKTPRTESYRCLVCLKQFPFKAFLQAHTKVCHTVRGENHAEACTCDVCGADVKNMFALKKHLMFHTEEYLYQCCTCGKQFVESGTLNNHMTTHKSGGMIRCKCCDKLFASRGALAKHKLALMEVKCHLCGQTFPNKTSRTEHYKTFHQSDILRCSQCSSMFSSQEELSVHMKKHQTYKKKQCPTCGKLFSRLEKHVITHKSKADIDESEMFVCDKCPRKFSNRSSFQRHLSIHSMDKPYQCPQCTRTFADCGVLRKHLRRHSALTPYQCEVCGKNFKELGNLNVHMRIHSDTKQFPCPHCPQAFKYKSSLDGHLRSRHPQVVPTPVCVGPEAHGPLQYDMQPETLPPGLSLNPLEQETHPGYDLDPRLNQIVQDPHQGYENGPGCVGRLEAEQFYNHFTQATLGKQEEKPGFSADSLLAKSLYGDAMMGAVRLADDGSMKQVLFPINVTSLDLAPTTGSSMNSSLF
ncbi:zinc finger protein draculin-like [Physella acuta]|uniref:zinc finger protein draculin-like n=1 Tax=Physella acuta TaxID=109671 RepID=UPI0027DDBB37|nr:zinc finger protein draculin-like [Physella acuta]